MIIALLLPSPIIASQSSDANLFYLVGENASEDTNHQLKCLIERNVESDTKAYQSITRYLDRANSDLAEMRRITQQIERAALMQRVVVDMLGAGLCFGLAYWGYSVGQKNRDARSARDFCNFSAVVLSVRGVVILFGGND